MNSFGEFDPFDVIYCPAGPNQSTLLYIDSFDAFYLLNPSGDLISTQEEFCQLFINYKWKVTMIC